MSGELLTLEAKMAAFARTFPSMADAPGVSLWDADAFDSWATATPLSHGERVPLGFYSPFGIRGTLGVAAVSM